MKTEPLIVYPSYLYIHRYDSMYGYNFKLYTYDEMFVADRVKPGDVISLYAADQTLIGYFPIKRIDHRKYWNTYEFFVDIPDEIVTSVYGISLTPSAEKPRIVNRVRGRIAKPNLRNIRIVNRYLILFFIAIFMAITSPIVMAIIDNATDWLRYIAIDFVWIFFLGYPAAFIAFAVLFYNLGKRGNICIDQHPGTRPTNMVS